MPAIDRADARTAPGSGELSDEYRHRVLQNAVREHQICEAFRALRSRSIEPILLKGWSVGRHYPDPVERQLGDIDLLVRDEELFIAEKELQDEHALPVDWHTFSGLRAEFAQPEDVLRRCDVVRLLDTDIRVLCDEDNLHFVAIHMLRHAGWSPAWVRDVAVLLDARSSNFNWHVCLGSDRIRAGWVLSALVVAHELLGADISRTPAKDHRIPEWLVPAVRKAQENPDPANNQPPESLWAALAHPWRLADGLRKRWPNPVTAAICTGVAFDQRSPLLHQLHYCAGLTSGFLRRSHNS